MIFFIIFIVIIHVVLLLATYYNLNTLSKKERWLFILIGIGIMYFLSTIVFSITDIGIDYGNEEAKEMITILLTFTFVPINGIITLPFLASSYNKYKADMLSKDAFKKRIIILAIIFIICYIFEFFYMKSIKVNMLEMVEQLNQNIGS